MVFEVRFPSFEFELACLSPSIFVVFVKSQKVGRRTERHFSKQDRCGQKEFFFLLSRLCAVIFQVIDVPVLVMCLCRRGATLSCVSNHRKKKKLLLLASRHWGIRRIAR